MVSPASPLVKFENQVSVHETVGNYPEFEGLVGGIFKATLLGLLTATVGIYVCTFLAAVGIPTLILSSIFLVAAGILLHKHLTRIRYEDKEVAQQILDDLANNDLQDVLRCHNLADLRCHCYLTSDATSLLSWAAAVKERDPTIYRGIQQAHIRKPVEATDDRPPPYAPGHALLDPAFSALQASIAGSKPDEHLYDRHLH